MSVVWMKLDVYPDGADEPTVLEVKPRQILQWERENRGRSAVQLNDDALKLEYYYEIAWLVMGKPDDFATFCTTTDVVQHQDVKVSSADSENEEPDDTESGPTQGEASTTIS